MIEILKIFRETWGEEGCPDKMKPKVFFRQFTKIENCAKSAETFKKLQIIKISFNHFPIKFFYEIHPKVKKVPHWSMFKNTKNYHIHIWTGPS